MWRARSEDSKQIFLALGQHFALQGQLDLFAAQILNSMRGDSRPQLGYRIDTLLDLLARVPGACRALARLVPGAGEAADRECSFSEKLRKYIETTAPASEEEESKRRGLIMLNSARRTLAPRVSLWLQQVLRLLLGNVWPEPAMEAAGSQIPGEWRRIRPGAFAPAIVRPGAAIADRDRLRAPNTPAARGPHT